MLEKKVYLSGYFHSNPYPVCLVDSRYNILKANRAFESLGTGSDAPQNLYHLLNNTNTKKWQSWLSDIIQTRDLPLEKSELNVRIDDRDFKLDGYLEPRSGVVFITIYPHQIDDKLELENYRQESKEQLDRLRVYQNILENSWDAIVFSNLKGEIFFANDSTTKLYGYVQDELNGKNIEIFNTQKSTHIPVMMEGLKGLGGWSGEVIHKKKDGSEFDVLLTINMIFNQSGQPMALVSTSKDISDKIQAQKESLQKTNELLEMKDRFVRELEQQVLDRTRDLKTEQEKSQNLLLNILPEDTVRELKEHGSAKPRQYESVSILFTDFSGFTRIANHLEPAELIEYLGYFFEAFDKIIARHNLEKIKTIGDSYMCAGGLPAQNLTHPVDAIRTGLELQKFVLESEEKFIKKNMEPWRLRIGIHTGPVVAGVVGSSKIAYDIWGDAVNIASRMESSGSVGRVNVSSATWQLAKNDFSFEHRGAIKVKNRGEIEMYYVLPG